MEYQPELQLLMLRRNDRLYRLSGGAPRRPIELTLGSI